jgi:hypothetical protein
VANHLQPHALPELHGRLVSLVSQARSFEAQARSISQGLQDLLLQFELGLPPRLPPTLHCPPTFTSGHVVANDACHDPTSADTPAIVSDTDVHQLSNQAADPQSRFLSPSWSQNHLGDGSIPTINSVPLPQAPAIVALPAPETNGGYLSVVPAALSASNEDGNSSSVATTSLMTQDTNVAYESVASGSPTGTNTENSDLFCSCDNCWLNEYAKL